MAPTMEVDAGAQRCAFAVSVLEQGSVAGTGGDPPSEQEVLIGSRFLLNRTVRTRVTWDRLFWCF